MITIYLNHKPTPVPIHSSIPSQYASSIPSLDSQTNSINLVKHEVKPANLGELLALSTEQLKKVDVARMNLLCATGLPGAEKLNNSEIEKYLSRLDQWAKRVKFETERHLYRLTDPKYSEHAKHYEHSEARFRAEWLIGVLQNDLGIHYHAGFVPQDQDVPPFKTSKETFINGLLDKEDPKKSFGGNCVSMPVIYVAVARRLGYPVKLVSSAEHVFCRWEGEDHANPKWRDRFNFDGAGKGFSIDSDEFYMNWPRKTSPRAVALFGWLKNLTPQQELALFLMSRGHVLIHVNNDYANAQVAYAQAAKLWPTSRQPLAFVEQCLGRLYEKQLAAHPDILASIKSSQAQRRYARTPRGIPDEPRNNRPWSQTPQGRAVSEAKMMQQIRENNQRNTQRQTQRMNQPVTPSPQSPNKYYKPYKPGQPLQ